VAIRRHFVTLEVEDRSLLSQSDPLDSDRQVAQCGTHARRRLVWALSRVGDEAAAEEAPEPHRQERQPLIRVDVLHGADARRNLIVVEGGTHAERHVGAQEL
jgi:hypothetical protein